MSQVDILTLVLILLRLKPSKPREILEAYWDNKAEYESGFEYESGCTSTYFIWQAFNWQPQGSESQVRRPAIFKYEY